MKTFFFFVFTRRSRTCNRFYNHKVGNKQMNKTTNLPEITGHFNVALQRPTKWGNTRNCLVEYSTVTNEIIPNKRERRRQTTNHDGFTTV